MDHILECPIGPSLKVVQLRRLFDWTNMAAALPHFFGAARHPCFEVSATASCIVPPYKTGLSRLQQPSDLIRFELVSFTFCWNSYQHLNPTSLLQTYEEISTMENARHTANVHTSGRAHRRVYFVQGWHWCKFVIKSDFRLPVTLQIQISVIRYPLVHCLFFYWIYFFSWLYQCWYWI